MVLGDFTTESTQYGKQEVTVKAKAEADLAEQLKEAVKHIQGTITEQEISDTELEEQVVSIPANPDIKNFSFALVGEDIYYRENSVMNKDGTSRCDRRACQRYGCYPGCNKQASGTAVGRMQ